MVITKSNIIVITKSNIIVLLAPFAFLHLLLHLLFFFSFASILFSSITLVFPIWGRVGGLHSCSLGLVVLRVTRIICKRTVLDFQNPVNIMDIDDQPFPA